MIAAQENITAIPTVRRVRDIRVWLLPVEADLVSAVSVGLWSVLVVGDVEFEGDDKGISR
ncbi:MAG: hypothetical protein CMJ69_07905 [Planctomycetaceae bacterium]|nr:hypothetical protein [Planctomycetaceae bacterium]